MRKMQAREFCKQEVVPEIKEDEGDLRQLQHIVQRVSVFNIENLVDHWARY